MSKDSREARRKRLRKLRQQAGLTQEQAAALIGKSTSLIRIWESGGGEPYPEYETALRALQEQGNG